jgi:hypothetical protein
MTAATAASIRRETSVLLLGQPAAASIIPASQQPAWQMPAFEQAS